MWQCQHLQAPPAGSPRFALPTHLRTVRVARGRKNQHTRQLVAAETSEHAVHQHVQPKPKRRVVVTGLGCVTSLGHDPKEFYDNLLEGKSGITQIEKFDTAGYSTRFAGEIKQLDVSKYVNRKMARRLDDVIKYTIVAGKKALEAAGIAIDKDHIDNVDKMRCGILVGTAMGGMATFAQAIEDLTQRSFKKMNPFCIPFAITNMSSALLAMDLGFMGPNYNISTACATGNYCILNAAEHIQRGEADLMLAGGAEAAIIPSGIGGFIACRALSSRNQDPTGASRPWDKNRDGFVMGEGAGVLVLEELEHAKARGVPILAEYLGGSFTCDAYNMTEPLPDGRGVSSCIERALVDSGVSADDVNYVNAHGTSTPVGDMAEYRAIRNALPGDHVRINSTKSMIGHLLGAAGAVEAVAVVQALQSGYLHPNLNLEDPEEDVDLNILVGSEKEKFDINVALSNSFGFGGHNSCILFRKFTS
ncbi:Protein TRANSPORT INHIBITOR RESPONSE 1 [Trebouxia sp. C0009 RCD-2024]